MALSGKPAAPPKLGTQTLYFLENGVIRSAAVIKVRAKVSNPLNDTDGVQRNQYFLQGYERPFEESEVFKTANLALKHIKGDYLNSDTNIEIISASNPVGDISGMTFKDVDISAMSLEAAITDGCSFENAVMPEEADTKAEFRALVSSYDPVTTIWTDGLKIGSE